MKWVATVGVAALALSALSWAGMEEDVSGDSRSGSV